MSSVSSPKDQDDGDSERWTTLYLARSRLRPLVLDALIFGASFVDPGTVADEVAAIVEDAVREQFKLNAAEYDLPFTDRHGRSPRDGGPA